MAWGTPAGKRVLKVDAKRHLVLKSVHPSPLSASKGFFTCKHFKLANDWLEKRYGSEGRVDWALIDGHSVFGESQKGDSEFGDDEAEREMLALAEREDSVAKKVEAVVKASVVGKKVDVKEVLEEVKAKGKEKGKEKVKEKVNGAEGDENVAPEEDEVEA